MGIMKISSAFLSISSLIPTSLSSSSSPCLGDCTGTDCTFTTKMDLYASSMGYFTFEECGDIVQPVLGLVHGNTYTFLQHDETNW